MTGGRPERGQDLLLNIGEKKIDRRGDLSRFTKADADDMRRVITITVGTAAATGRVFHGFKPSSVAVVIHTSVV